MAAFGHLGCFHRLGIVHNASMNIPVYVLCVWAYVFISHMYVLWSEIAGSPDHLFLIEIIIFFFSPLILKKRCLLPYMQRL